MNPQALQPSHLNSFCKDSCRQNGRSEWGTLERFFDRFQISLLLGTAVFGSTTLLTLRLVHLCLSTEFLLLMAAEIIGKCPRWRSPRAASRKHFLGSGSDLSGHVETAERKAGESKGLRWEEVVAGGESARPLLATSCRPLSRSVLRICKVPLALSHARQPVLC